MNKYFISLLILSACLLCSCNYRVNQQYEKILTSVADLMDSKPDSARLLLKTINVKELNEPLYNRFIVLKVNVKDKLYMNATEDTVVFQATNYFLKNNNSEYKLLSCFVSAKVYEELNNQKKAMEYYSEAIKWIDKKSNFLLNGDIYYNLSRLFSLKNQYYHSITYAESARKYYDLANCNYEKKIYTNELLVFNYLALNEIDSSIHYSIIALDLAYRYHNIQYQRHSLHSLAVSYRAAKEFKKAKEKCRQALSLTKTTDSLNIGRLQLTLGGVFFEEAQYDSATICLYNAKRLIKNTDNINDYIALNSLLGEVEVKNKNYEQALNYKELSDSHLLVLKSLEAASRTILAKHQENGFKDLQAERDKVAKKRWLLFIAFIVLCLIILLATFFYKFKVILGKFKVVIEKKDKELEKKDKEITQMKYEFEKTVTELKNDFSLEQLLIVFQINATAELDDILTARDMQTNYRKAQVQVKLLVDSITWETAFIGLKNAHNGLAAKLKADFPDLSEKEYRVFLLSCSGFSVMGIAKILKYSISTIQGFQTDVRKKTGIASSGSFTDFVYQKYDISINH